MGKKYYYSYLALILCALFMFLVNNANAQVKGSNEKSNLGFRGIKFGSSYSENKNKLKKIKTPKHSKNIPKSVLNNLSVYKPKNATMDLKGAKLAKFGYFYFRHHMLFVTLKAKPGDSNSHRFTQAFKNHFKHKHIKPNSRELIKFYYNNLNKGIIAIEHCSRKDRNKKQSCQAMLLTHSGLKKLKNLIEKSNKNNNSQQGGF